MATKAASGHFVVNFTKRNPKYLNIKYLGFSFVRLIGTQ